jgi:hypothetical protein
MTSNVTDRDLVRRYLLGRLDEQAEVEGKLSERILFDNEMAEIVDSVEDDIVEEYLDGSLDSADRRDVETYFLQAPERNEKLRFAKLLRRHFETKSSHHSRTEHDSLLRPPLAWSSYLRTYGQMAALLLLGISSVIYITLREPEARSAVIAATDCSANPSRGPLTQRWWTDASRADQGLHSTPYRGNCATRRCV